MYTCSLVKVTTPLLEAVTSLLFLSRTLASGPLQFDLAPVIVSPIVTVRVPLVNTRILVFGTSDTSVPGTMYFPGLSLSVFVR